MSYIRVNAEHKIPLIRELDLLIINGGLSGLEIARSVSLTGQKVMIVESHTYLGGIVTKAQRPWLNLKDCENKLVQIWYPEDAGTVSENCEYIKIFVPDELKKKLRGCS